MAETLRIGTRMSPLSLAQAKIFASRIDTLYEIIPMTTQGDQLQNICLKDVGGKALFSHALHEALLENRIDAAVHSLKDLETFLPDGIEIGCIFDQEDREDVLILKPSLKELPENALIGTCSPRRQALMQYYYPQVRFTLFRGNVETRLKKLLNNEVDATLLALSGLKRLNIWHNECIVFSNQALPAKILPLHQFPCAVGQGFLAVTCRSRDKHFFELFNLQNTIAFQERELLQRLSGDCYTALGVNFSKSSLMACYTPSASYPLFWQESHNVQTLEYLLRKNF